MKIFYIGDNSSGTTALDRLTAMQRLGHAVTAFNVSDFEARNRLLRSIQWRFSPKLLIRALNDRIQCELRSQGPYDLIWVDKGVWILPETLEAAREHHAPQIVHYTPDSQIWINRSKHFLQSINLYSCIVTTKEFEIKDYYLLGAKRVICTLQSFCPERFASRQPDPLYSCDVGLISDYKFHYGRTVRFLSHHVDDVAVWGPRWGRGAVLSGLRKGVVKGAGIWGQAYVNALSSFKIGLGLLSKYIPEQHTSRSIEVPAAGTFLLAERTPQHEGMFQAGIEAEFFSSREEMADKAQHYLKNDSGRQRIAAKGRERCEKSGYDTDSTMKRIISEIDRL